TEALRKKFMEAITNYQQVEFQNRQKYRQRLERQYKIVKPGATQEEIDAALDNEEGTQVFAQSLMQSTRYGAAREALKEVQQRHDDIKKIEKTIEELANLFEEMQLMVEVQDTQIDQIEQHANDVEQNLSSGVDNVGKALEHAKSARR
ncbi:9749_t:CDS:2, partial [Paraglomus occultum]